MIVRPVRVIVSYWNLHSLEIFALLRSKCRHLIRCKVHFFDWEQIVFRLVFIFVLFCLLLPSVAIDSFAPDLAEDFTNTSATTSKTVGSSLNFIAVILCLSFYAQILSYFQLSLWSLSDIKFLQTLPFLLEVFLQLTQLALLLIQYVMLVISIID